MKKGVGSKTIKGASAKGHKAASSHNQGHWGREGKQMGEEGNPKPKKK